MSIKYAVLALIVEKPQHGYAVRNAFESRLSDVREIGYGQIYQVLAALEKDGFVRGVSNSRGVRRIVYTATRQGRAALGGWLLGAGLAQRGFLDDIFLRLLFVAPDHVEGMICFLAGQIRQVREDLHILRDQVAVSPPPEDPAGRMRLLYVEAEILHREADLAALQLGLQELDRLWPKAGRRRVVSEKAAPSREKVMSPDDKKISGRKRVAKSGDHRWRSRCG